MVDSTSIRTHTGRTIIMHPGSCRPEISKPFLRQAAVIANVLMVSLPENVLRDPSPRTSQTTVIPTIPTIRGILIARRSKIFNQQHITSMDIGIRVHTSTVTFQSTF